MTKSLPKLVLSASRDIPFSQLALSQKNVRRVKSGLSIEDLAEDIYRRTLLQSLNVRPMLDEHGNPTGMFEVPAGGRRYRALELLVKTKRMHRDQPVPCVVRESGTAEEDSLAENVMRVGLHPLDQFRAFRTLIDGGLSEDDIAARFFVSVSTVRQRLRLASVSPSLLDIYGEDGMTLEQLMAFSVTDNHVRQQQVWDQINQASHAPAAPGPCETSGHGSEADKGTARALPERLVSELTAARTVAIRDTLAQAPHTAFLALLHALCLSAFRFNTRTGCVEIAVTQVWLGTVAPSLRETVWSIRIQQRHDRWSERLPDDTSCLWDWLAALGPDEQMELLAHCVSLGVNALFEPVKGHDGRVSAHGIAQRLAAADALAACLDLDMACAGWGPTVDNYLGRVPKPKIIEAVREARRVCRARSRCCR